ncbi:hypothetical protein GCM10022629_27800 [Amorphoplanes auranticolor]
MEMTPGTTSNGRPAKVLTAAVCACPVSTATTCGWAAIRAASGSAPNRRIESGDSAVVLPLESCGGGP